LGCLPVIKACFGVDGSNFNRTHLPWHSSTGTGSVGNGDVTVTDRLTGLTWLKDASCFGTMVWSQAVAEANAFNSGECGIADGSAEGDLRLPNSNEMRSLIDPGQDNPSLPVGHPFAASEWHIYWSSSSGGGKRLGCGHGQRLLGTLGQGVSALCLAGSRWTVGSLAVCRHGVLDA
jgi:hypothetical protein